MNLNKYKKETDKNNYLNILNEKINHTQKQQQQLSKYDTDVLNYNNIPVKNTPITTQAQPLIIHNQPLPSLSESFYSPTTYTKVLYNLLLLLFIFISMYIILY